MPAGGLTEKMVVHVRDGIKGLSADWILLDERDLGSTSCSHNIYAHLCYCELPIDEPCNNCWRINKITERKQ